VVVGGGHNGLVCAFYLARAGLTPLVLEARPEVGGAAATEELLPGVRVPALAHALGPLRTSIVQDMRLVERGVRFIDADPILVALDGRGRSVTFFRDTSRTQQSLAALSGRDAERYPAFVETLKRLAPVLRELLESTPPDVDRPDRSDLWRLLTAGRRFRALPRQDAYRLLRWMPMAVGDLVSEYFESDLAQAAVAARALGGANLGPWSAATGALLLLYAASDPFPTGSSITVVGGPGVLAQAMAKAAIEAGAEVRTNAIVTRIETGAAGVEAVRLASGETIAARAVVSNADPRRTFLALLDPMVLEPAFVNRVRNYRMRGTTAKVNLVLDGAPPFRVEPDLLSGRVHLGPGIDYLERAFDAAKYGRPSDRPWLDVTIPSISDRQLASNGRHAVSIVAHFAPYHLRDESWDALREPFGDTVVRTLEEYAPGIGSRVLARKVYTPADLETQFGLTGGHVHHGEPGLDQLFIMRPVMGWARYRTPVQGLFLCGAGTHPGLGLTGGSGQNAAREILKLLK
jgi:phytoene dehydrogenase-like protein